jgi:hypothetical protein
MATEEDRKRRALAGLQLTPEGREYLSAQGVPEQVYRDPRDESIAATPALIRPIASMLDRMANPGRAGTAASMNLGLAQKAQQRQLDAAKLKGAQEDANMKELQMLAATGDKKALKKLRDYSIAMNAYRMQQNPLTGLGNLFGGGGNDGAGQARPIGGMGGTTPPATAPATEVPESPTLTQVDNMTPSQVREQSVRDIADIDSRIAEQEEILSTGMMPQTLKAGQGAYGAGYQYVPPVTVPSREATVGELKKAQETLTALQQQKQQVQSTAERFSPTSSRQ